ERVAYLSELVDRWVGMGGIRHHTAASAIHQQVHPLQHGLADEDFIAQDEGVFFRVPCQDFEDDYADDANLLFAPIGVFNHLFAPRLETQAADNRRRQDTPHGACVHCCLGC